MAEATTTPSLSEQYLLEKKEKADADSKSVEIKQDVSPASTGSEEVVPEKAEETPAAAAESEAQPENTHITAAAEENTESNSANSGNNTEDAPAVAEESNEPSNEEASEEQESPEEKPEIKLETAPADFRFPTTNQTRHCFTRYIEYHRCVAAKGEGAPECDKFSKYYRSLCPSEWVERWNEQRANGTFPGPL